MAQTAPKRFELQSDPSTVRIGEIDLHQDFETDHSGRHWKKIWLTGRAEAGLEDFEKLDFDLSFSYSDDSNQLGTCDRLGLTINGADEEKSIAFKADGDTRIDSNMVVTKIGLSMTIVVRLKTENHELVPVESHQNDL